MQELRRLVRLGTGRGVRVNEVTDTFRRIVQDVVIPPTEWMGGGEGRRVSKGRSGIKVGQGPSIM